MITNIILYLHIACGGSYQAGHCRKCSCLHFDFFLSITALEDCRARLCECAVFVNLGDDHCRGGIGHWIEGRNCSQTKAHRPRCWKGRVSPLELLEHAHTLIHKLQTWPKGKDMRTKCEDSLQGRNTSKSQKSWLRQTGCGRKWLEPWAKMSIEMWKWALQEIKAGVFELFMWSISFLFSDLLAPFHSCYVFRVLFRVRQKSFHFKSTDHGAKMIGSGTSEKRHRVCGQLRLQQASQSSIDNTEKIENRHEYRSRHVQRLFGTQWFEFTIWQTVLPNSTERSLTTDNLPVKSTTHPTDHNQSTNTS